MKAPLLTGVVAIAVAVPLGYNIHRHAQAQLRAIRQRIAQEQMLQRTQTEIGATLEQVERYRKRLPSEPNTSWLVNEIVTLTEQANLQLSTITQTPPQVFPQFTRLAIEIELSASYHQLGTFLDRLERAEQFIQVEHLEMLSGNEKDGNVRIRLMLSTIYLPPAADLVRSS